MKVHRSQRASGDVGRRGDGSRRAVFGRTGSLGSAVPFVAHANPAAARLQSLQARASDGPAVQRLEAFQRLADAPAQLGAHAVARGRDTKFGQGQEGHLPHDAWHVVQQAEGRVRPTTQVYGAPINDDAGLEAEAAREGQRALAVGRDLAADQADPVARKARAGGGTTRPVVQRATIGDTMDNYLNVNQNRFNTLANNLQPLVNNLQHVNGQITADKLKNATLDLSYTISNDPTLMPFLLSDLTDPINYSSCYPFAASIFGVLGTREQAGAGSADNFASAFDFRGAVANLCTAIKSAATSRQEKIFRIEYAGHGFILATRPDNNNNMVVEHFESLAHTAALIDSLPYNPYDVDQTCAALRDMASDDLTKRRQGAWFFNQWIADSINLGPAATNDSGAFYLHRMKWWSRDLLNNWATRWQNQVRARYNQIRVVLHPATPQW